MILEIHVCDKCKRPDRPVARENGFGEFCADCYSDIMNRLQETYDRWIDEPEEAPEPKPEKAPVLKPKHRGGKKPIDWDKACALRQAGWNSEKIADELGCSRLTIENHLGKKYALYKEGHRETVSRGN